MTEPTVTLKELMEEKFCSQEKELAALKELVESKFFSQKEAVDKAEQSLKEYKVQANEFRGTLKDQAAAFATRSEVEALAAQVVDLQRGASRGEGGSSAINAAKSNSQWTIALWVGIGLSVGGIVVSLFKH